MAAFALAFLPALTLFSFEESTLLLLLYYYSAAVASLQQIAVALFASTRQLQRPRRRYWIIITLQKQKLTFISIKNINELSINGDFVLYG